MGSYSSLALLLVAAAVLCIKAQSSFEVDVAMLHTRRPVVTWHSNPLSCSAGTVLVATRFELQTHNFSSPLQRFRLPKELPTRVVHKVRVQCSDGRLSTSKTFMVNLEAPDWDPSVWIQGANQSTGRSTNLFRRSFQVPFEQSASVHVAVAGYYEAFINQARLNSDTFLDPGFTHFSTRTLYVSYFDVQLQKGENVVGIMAGGGWYGMSAGYAQVPKIRVVVMGENGQPLAFTDDSWTTAQGPITMDSVYNGETFNASMTIPGWHFQGFDDSTWAHAALVEATIFNPQITQRSMPPIKQNSTLKPIQITSPKAGTWVVDFGRAISGFTQLTVTGPKGSVVTMHHGEILDHYNVSNKGQVYFGNLRSALATDTYILGGVGTEVYMPHFTYHGFRFVQIDSWPPGSTPTVDNFLAIQFSSAVQPIGSFSSSSDIMNMVHQATVWGQANNLMSVPTDCNQRDERLGWMADAWLSSEEAVSNYDMYTFYQNYMMLMRDDQLTNGGIGDVIPFIRYGSNPGDPSWGSAYPIILEQYNLLYNDVDTVQEHYQGAKDWTNFLIRSAQQTGMANMYGYYGDWVPPPPARKVPIAMTSGFSLLRSIQVMTGLSQMLGYTQDTLMWKKNFQDWASAYNNAWYSSTSKNYGPLQSGDVLAMALGIASNGTDLSLLAKLTATENHFDTGMIGLRYLFPILTEIGRQDVAITVATQTSYPGYAYEYMNSIETPTYTLWELWDGPNEGPGMNSRDHIMDGSVDAWFHKYVGGVLNDGIQVPRSHYSTVRSAKSSTRNAYGDISVEWSVTGGILCVHEVEPANLILDCGGDSVIQKIEFVSVGQPHGVCAANQKRSATCDASLDLSHCIGVTKCITPKWWEGKDRCGMRRARVAVRAQCSMPPKIRVAVAVPKDTPVSIPVPIANAVVVAKVGAGLSDVTSIRGNQGHFQTTVSKGHHEWILSGDSHPTRLMTKPRDSTLHFQCPPQTFIAAISDVSAVCGGQVLLQHLEKSCVRRDSCEASLGPVLDHIEASCFEGVTVAYECTL